MRRFDRIFGLIVYFVTRCRVGVASVGAAGEIAKVNHVFQPAGRLAASNSPYALKFKYPCMLPTGKMYPICGPTPRTRDLKPPRSGLPPVSSEICWYAYPTSPTKTCLERNCAALQSK